MKFHINRSKNLIQYLEDHGWTEALPNELSDFSLWDIYYNPDVQSKIKVWPKKGFSTMIDCLWTWHKRLEKFNLTHLSPYTITDWELMQLSEDDFKNGQLWFFKQIFGVHGKGINLISNYNEYLTIQKSIQEKIEIQGPCLMEDLKHQYILQKGMINTHLIQGRKYILRVYTLTQNNNTFVYNDCLYYTAIFPVKYDYLDCYVGKNNKVYPLSVKNKKNKTFVPKDQMRKNVHVSHWKSDEEGKYNIIDNRKMGLLSDLPIYRKVMKNIFHNVREMSLLYQDMIQEYTDCETKPFHFDVENSYQVWGSDYIVMKDLSVKCLEINAFPNLTHGDPHKGQIGSKKRPHELKFRKKGFDRDLMRIFGYDLEQKGNEYPNNWVVVNDKNPINTLHLQKQKKKTKKKKKSPKKKKKSSKKKRKGNNYLWNMI